jgi:hypothetical protein
MASDLAGSIGVSPAIAPRQFLRAFRATASRPAVMIDLDADLLIFRFEHDFTHSPRRSQAKNLLVWFFVLYLGTRLPEDSVFTHSGPG